MEPETKESKTNTEIRCVEFDFKCGTNSEDKRKALYGFARLLIEKHHIKTIKDRNREIYIFRDGVYFYGEEIVKKEIREVFKEHVSSHNVREIIETVKDLTPTERDEFQVDPNIINLNNGIFDINTWSFKSHDPLYLFLTKIPMNFKEGAECPVIKKFLEDVLDEEQIRVIQEWAGFLLYRKYFIKKALICVGEGDTGKSTLLNLLNIFMGRQNVSSITLQKISNDKFSSSSLYNKHVNISDDLSFKDINDGGTFKMVTGGGPIGGEEKFKTQFTFINFAKLTFSCNKIPDVKDSDDKAYFKRWIVLRFNYPVEEKDKDARLIEKMTSEEELAGFLNFALIGLKRLLENEQFSYDKNQDEIKAEMQNTSSSIAMFAHNCLEISSDDWISKEDMYEAYKKYALENKVITETKSRFGRRITRYANYIQDGKPANQETGKQITAWMGVQFKDPLDFEFPKEEITEQSDFMEEIS